MWAFDLVICNGLTRWAKSGNFTCNTYNGASVVDYVICSHGLYEKMEGSFGWRSAVGFEIRSQANSFMFFLDWKERIRVKNSACPTKSPRGQNSFDLKKL